MKSWFICAAAFALAVSAGSADAKKGQKGPNNGGGGIVVFGGPDLVGESIQFKIKCKQGLCQLNNFRLMVKNQGDVDMPNSRVEFWLSDDTLLDTITDPETFLSDTLIHTQSLGKIKAGKTKKRTVGGGHLKQLGAVSGQHIIAVVNPGGVVPELDALNNEYLSAPLP